MSTVGNVEHVQQPSARLRPSRESNNQEVSGLSQEPHIVKVIRLGRVKWAGMKDSAVPNKPLVETIHGVRRVDVKSTIPE